MDTTVSKESIGRGNIKEVERVLGSISSGNIQMIKKYIEEQEQVIEDS